MQNKNKPNISQADSTNKTTSASHHSGGAFSSPHCGTASAIGTPPKPTDINSLIIYGEGYAKSVMSQLGRVQAIMLALTREGNLLQHKSGDFLNEYDKDLFEHVCRLLCVAKEVTCTVMVLECWMARNKPGDPAERPSEALDRKEIVLVVGENFTGQTVRLHPVIRTGIEDFFGFGEVQEIPPDGSEGRFIGMLPRKKPTFDARRKALAQLTALGVSIQSCEPPYVPQ